MDKGAGHHDGEDIPAPHSDGDCTPLRLDRMGSRRLVEGDGGMSKQLTESAQVAKEIRKILKAHNIKGSVRSSNYSGGNSVRVRFAQEVTAEEYAKIYQEADKWRAGSFNSMDDIYEYRHIEGPTANYIFFTCSEGYSMGYPRSDVAA